MVDLNQLLQNVNFNFNILSIFLSIAIFILTPIILKYLSRGEGVKSKEELKESIAHSSHNSSKLDTLAIEIENLKENHSLQSQRSNENS